MISRGFREGEKYGFRSAPFPETILEMTTTPQSILVIEDDVNLLNSLAFILEQRGFAVLRASTGEDGVPLALRHRPELVLLDLTLPGMDGFAVAERLEPLRSIGTKIVILTGRDVEDDMVRALERCADDYVVKPVRPRVLLARLTAVLRRARGASADTGVVRVRDIEIHPAAFEARRAGEKLALTKTEFNLLLLFARNAGAVLEREEIVAAVHGADCHLAARSIDFHINALRHKLGDDGELIATVRGVGFKLVADG
jgi:two-component system, OmpR family, response regulator RstA